ncbi:MAG TPA: hypothetical protein PKW94_00330 [Candidatus Dojkabacteria bacterium]|nr:hypothetical protein [Candidatus Dojkabacteria bacterium]HOR05944.1 hypothetical protein [Candidatus Dojkabacteria bacterium]HOT60742.1 hypothetical protein [Candidatus Dojkabacteria bacterium]HQI92533.1 hypothetical protein [Candidatus Dojkabacteria bacterium]
MNANLPKRLMNCNKVAQEKDEPSQEEIHIPKDTKCILRKAKKFLPRDGEVWITAADKKGNVTIHILQEGRKRGKTITCSAKHCKAILLKYSNSLLVEAKFR